MNTQAPSTEHLDQPQVRAAFRSAKLLVGTYVVISVLTFVAIVLFRHDAGVVNDAVWIRGTIVAATSLLSYSFAVRASRGNRSAFLRLRIISAVLVVAIAVIVSLPGTFPLWMKIEQGICGLVLIGVVAQVNGKHLRSVFAAR